MSAAPSTPNPSFGELAFNPIGDIVIKYEQYIKQLKCAQTVTGKVIGDSDLKGDFQNFTGVVKYLMTQEWTKCNLTIENGNYFK